MRSHIERHSFQDQSVIALRHPTSGQPRQLLPRTTRSVALPVGSPFASAMPPFTITCDIDAREDSLRNVSGEDALFADPSRWHDVARTDPMTRKLRACSYRFYELRQKLQSLASLAYLNVSQMSQELLASRGLNLRPVRLRHQLQNKRARKSCFCGRSVASQLKKRPQ
jgi:hypothetical protein